MNSVQPLVEYECSNCGQTTDYPVSPCPSCGAVVGEVRCGPCGYRDRKRVFIEHGHLCPRCGESVTIAEEPPRPARVPASPQKRVGAFLIDSALIILTWFFVIPLVAPADEWGSGLFGELLRAAGLTGYWLAYHVLLEASDLGGTLGKRALGLRVAGVNGHRISLGRSLVRTTAKFISALPLGFGILMIWFTRWSQGLHDFIGGTLVLEDGTAGD